MSEETEKKAKAMGWVPEDEFRGNPDKWVDADKFVERGENIMPILKENLDRALTKLEALETARQKDQESFKKFQEFASKAEERSFKAAEANYKKEVATLKRELKEAAKAEDWSKFDDIEKNIDTLEKPLPPDITSPNAPNPDTDPVFVEWNKGNEWYKSDMEMTRWADSVAQFVKSMNPDLAGKAFFDEVAKQTKEKFPDKFENKKQKDRPMEGGGEIDDKLSKGGKKKWSDIPASERADAEKAYQEYKNIIPGYTREEYLKNYEF